MAILSSCDDEDEPDPYIIWDFVPLNVQIYVQDADGNNLLVPTTAGYLRGTEIVAIYNDKEYALDWDSPRNAEVPSRYYLPTFSGLTIGWGTVYTDKGIQYEESKNHLAFGEFDRAEDVDISLTLRIDGYSETWDIDLTNRLEWINKEPHSTVSARLNGKEVDYNDIVITLK